MFDRLISLFDTPVPLTAWKAVGAPSVSYVPPSFWPWIVFGIFILLVLYVFQR